MVFYVYRDCFLEGKIVGFLIVVVAIVAMVSLAAYFVVKRVKRYVLIFVYILVIYHLFIGYGFLFTTSYMQ